MSLQATPLYTTFFDVAEAEQATFLGSHLWAGHLFDVYIVDSCVDGLKEILAVPADHASRGPIAMEATLCKDYAEGHPLQTGWLISNAKGLL